MVSCRAYNHSLAIVIVAHADVFPDSGAQPITNEDGSVALAVNGEIYNHLALRKQLKDHYHFKTTSDCEVIIQLVSGGEPGVRGRPLEGGKGRKA